MYHELHNSIVLLIPIVGTVSVCALVAVAIWATQRRREREIHYRHELLKKLVEKGADKEEVGALMREQAMSRWVNQREGTKIGGVVLLSTGIGLMIGLRFIEEEALWLVGFIPAFIGLGLLMYAFLMAPRADRT